MSCREQHLRKLDRLGYLSNEASRRTIFCSRRTKSVERTCSTKLYDRTGDEITLDEVERITILNMAQAPQRSVWRNAFSTALFWLKIGGTIALLVAAIVGLLG